MSVQTGSRMILGTRIDGTSYDDATRRILAWALAGESRSVYAANVHTVMEAYDHPTFRAMVNDCDLVTPDGMPLVWGLRWHGIGNASRVYGPDLTPYVLKAAEEQNVAVGFFGGSLEVLLLLLKRVKADFPQLRVVYQEAPPFRTLHQRYPVETLGEALAEGIETGHPAMPEFTLDPDRIHDLLSYLKTLE